MLNFKKMELFNFCLNALYLSEANLLISSMFRFGNLGTGNHTRSESDSAVYSWNN